MHARRISRLLAPVLALPVAAVFLVGCDDGCPEGQSQQVVGHVSHYHPGTTSYSGKTRIFHPGYTSYDSIYECRPK